MEAVEKSFAEQDTTQEAMEGTQGCVAPIEQLIDEANEQHRVEAAHGEERALVVLAEEANGPCCVEGA
jgi:hypothetical protein